MDFSQIFRLWCLRSLRISRGGVCVVSYLIRCHCLCVSLLPALIEKSCKNGSLAGFFLLHHVLWALITVPSSFSLYSFEQQTCRLIINMQAVSTNHESPNTSTTMIFTTIFTDQMAFEDIMSEDHRRQVTSLPSIGYFLNVLDSSHFREIPVSVTIDTSHRQATEFKQQDASIQTTLVRSTSLT